MSITARSPCIKPKYFFVLNVIFLWYLREHIIGDGVVNSDPTLPVIVSPFRNAMYSCRCWVAESDEQSFIRTRNKYPSRRRVYFMMMSYILVYLIDIRYIRHFVRNSPSLVYGYDLCHPYGSSFMKDKSNAVDSRRVKNVLTKEKSRHLKIKYLYCWLH